MSYIVVFNFPQSNLIPHASSLNLNLEVVTKLHKAYFPVQLIWPICAESVKGEDI